MEEPTNELPSTQSPDAVMHDVNGKFNALMDLSRRGSAPLDLTRSGALLPEFESFRDYLEARRVEAQALSVSEFHRAQLVGFLDSRLLTVNEYIKILQSQEDAKKG